MKKTAIIAVMLLLGATRAGAQVDSSCLVMWQYSPLKPNDVAWFNSDSVKVNMCQGSEYLSEFAKNKFEVDFLYYVFPGQIAPAGDSIVRHWRDIDTLYSDVRNAFDSIEHRFGIFTLWQVSLGDTSTIGDKDWNIKFDSYLNVDTVLYYLSQVPWLDTIYTRFGGRPLFFEGVENNLTQDRISIWPQPCTRRLNIKDKPNAEKPLIYDPLGRRIDRRRRRGRGGAAADI